MRRICCIIIIQSLSVLAKNRQKDSLITLSDYQGNVCAVVDDPLAENHPDQSPYLHCAGNPVNYIDPDGRDWVFNQNVGYKWDDDITVDSQLSEGWEYVGTDNNSILNHLGVSGKNYSANDRFLMGSGGNLENGGSTYNNSFLNISVNIRFEAIVESKKFMGIEMKVNESYREISNNDVTISPATKLEFEYGGEVKESHFHAPTKDTIYRTGCVPRESEYFFDSQSLLKYGLPSTVNYTGGWNYSAPAGHGAVGYLGIGIISGRDTNLKIQIK